MTLWCGRVAWHVLQVKLPKAESWMLLVGSVGWCGVDRNPGCCMYLAKAVMMCSCGRSIPGGKRVSMSLRTLGSRSCRKRK